MTDYRPWDREEHCGPPPWKPDDPNVIAWEKAHGHDIRLKCYPEFGCQVLEAQRERLEEAARAFVDHIESFDALPDEERFQRFAELKARAHELYNELRDAARDNGLEGTSQ